MKPTDKKLTFIGVNIDKVVDGKIVGHGGAVNTFETLFQEGLIKPNDSMGCCKSGVKWIKMYCAK